MPRNSQRKRKTYGVVRDLDEDFLQHRDDSENDNDNDNEDGSGDSNDDDDDDDDDDYLIEENNTISSSKKRSKKKTGNERNIGSGSKKKAGKTTNRNETSQEKTSKTEKKTPAKRKSGGSGKKDPITIDDDDDDNDNEETTTTKTATPNEKKKKPKVTLDSFDVVLPSSIIDGGGCSSENQCTLLVEVTDPKDAIALGEFGGSVGAIGRFESDPNGITLDLKGNQYRGSLLPGPTCMVVGFPSSFGFKKKETATATTGATEDHQAEEESPSATAIVGTLRVEGITDEYATLVQIDDHMKKLDAIVTGNQNDVDDGHDENENENYHTNDKSDKGQQ